MAGLLLLALSLGFYLAVLGRRLQSGEPRPHLVPFLACGAFPVIDHWIASALGTTEQGTALIFGASTLALYLVVIAPSDRMPDRFGMVVLGLAPVVATLVSGLGPDVFASHGPFATQGEEVAFWHNVGQAVLLGLLAWSLARQAATHTDRYRPVSQV